MQTLRYIPSDFIQIPAIITSPGVRESHWFSHQIHYKPDQTIICQTNAKAWTSIKVTNYKHTQTPAPPPPSSPDTTAPTTKITTENVRRQKECGVNAHRVTREKSSFLPIHIYVICLLVTRCQCVALFYYQMQFQKSRRVVMDHYYPHWYNSNLFVFVSGAGRSESGTAVKVII